MAVSLVKGQNVSLTKAAPDLKTMTVGLGWDTRKSAGAAFDLDAIAFMVGDDDKVLSDGHMVFFGNKSAHGVTLSGDNRTGEGDGDDEQIRVSLSEVPANVAKIEIAIAIYEETESGLNFGLVDKSFCRIVDDKGGEELARIDLQEDAGHLKAVLMGTIYRGPDGQEWKFRARGDGFASLKEMAKHYGVDV